MNKNGFETGWLVAFIELKGVFTTNKIVITKKTNKGEKIYAYNNPVFYADSKDPFPVETARRILGIGKVTKYRDLYRLEIRKKEDLLNLVHFLSKHSLSGTKSDKFLGWREKVLQWKSRGRRKTSIV